MRSGVLVYHTTNTQFQGNIAPVGLETYSNSPRQAYVDFDTLGAEFWVLIGGRLGSSGMAAPGMTWRLRIDGTYKSNTTYVAVDGTVICEQQTGALGAFGTWVVKEKVTNIWSGRHLLQLTGQAASWPFALSCTWMIIPAAE